MPKLPYNPQTETLETLVDDVVERQDATRSKEGLTIGREAQPDAKPQIRYTGRYGDFVLEGDLYISPGGLLMHLYCPVCSTPEAPHNLSIKSENKQMSWDKERGISVSAFGCTWELPEANTRKLEFGLGLCPWKVTIENNRARDA